MFERFTEQARQVVVLAQEEARTLGHNYIGTEHILLGLLREEDGLGARALESLGIKIREVRREVVSIVGEGDELASGQIPFTPRGKKVLELSIREALALGHNYIGTEHLLLALARENEGVAMQILHGLGTNDEEIENAVIAVVSAKQRATPSPPRRKARRAFTYSIGQVFSPASLFLAGWLLFGISLGIGVLIGWLIWG